MKKTTKIKNILSLFLSLFMIFGSIIYPVYAMEIGNDLIEPLAYEEYTKTQDFGMGDTGYVTCTIKVRYDFNTNKYTLRSANVVEHFSAALPLFHLTGSVTTNPVINGEIPSSGKVLITFRYSDGLGNTWSKTLTMYS